MAQQESDDLDQLMPNLQQRARQHCSPANTVALRQYIKVLGEKPSNVPAPANLPPKPRTDALELRNGTGRRPQRRFFTIKWREEDPAEEAAEEQEEELDPEALKLALLQQARLRRQALLEAALRPGTGRVPRQQEFAITLPPLQLEEEGRHEELQEQLAAEGAEEDQDLLADAAWEAADDAEAAHEQAWQAAKGTLAEQQQQAAPRVTDAACTTSPAATPGAPLLQHCEQAQPGTCRLELADSQLGQAKTPAFSQPSRYTPMEGVPERLGLLATRRKQPAATASCLPQASGTPAGFTPLEGVPERLGGFQPLPGGPRPLGLAGATRICSNGAARSVDSPVEGLVQQDKSRASRDAPAPADNHGGFAGFAPPSPRVLQQEQKQQHAQQQDGEHVHLQIQPVQAEQQQGQQHVERAEEDDWEGDDGGDVGYGDDGGYFEDAEPQPDGLSGGFPFLAERSPARVADARVQAVDSLGAGQQAAAVAAAGAHGAELDEQLARGGLGDIPEPLARAQQRAPRRPTKDPGSRLRNECKRKSLAADGRHEVLPGVRRSSRGRQEPLKWWLNERQEFGRQHMTMPTVRGVVHKTPNTPWQTVTDIKRKPPKRQRAPTPHDLNDALADEEGQPAQQRQQGGASDAEEGWPGEQQEQQPLQRQHDEQAEREDEAQQQRRQQGRQRGRQRQQPDAQPARRQQAKRAAGKKQPPAKAKPTKKKSSTKQRRRG